jgi:hypothetical protein
MTDGLWLVSRLNDTRTGTHEFVGFTSFSLAESNLKFGSHHKLTNLDHGGSLEAFL